MHCLFDIMIIAKYHIPCTEHMVWTYKPVRDTTVTDMSYKIHDNFIAWKYWTIQYSLMLSFRDGSCFSIKKCSSPKCIFITKLITYHSSCNIVGNLHSQWPRKWLRKLFDLLAYCPTTCKLGDQCQQLPRLKQNTDELQHIGMVKCLQQCHL